MSIMPINVGLIQGFSGIASDRADSARRQRRSDALSAGFDALGKVGVAWIDRMKREGRQEEFDKAMEEGPESVSALLTRRASEGDDDARQLLGHFAQQPKINDQIKFARNREERAAVSFQAKQAESKKKADAEGVDFAARKSIADNIRKSVGVNAGPEDRARISNLTRRLEAGETVSDDEIAGAMPGGRIGVRPTPSTAEQTVAATVAARVPAIAPQLTSDMRRRGKAMTDEQRAVNRRMTNDLLRQAKTSPDPEIKANAAKAEYIIMTDTINRPKIDGTPWGPSDLLNLYDELPEMNPANRAVLFSRAQSAIEQRDAALSTAPPDLIAAAAQGAPEAVAALSASTGVSPADINAAIRAGRNDAFWNGPEAVRILQPGDELYSAKHADDYIQFVFWNGEPGYWLKPLARSRGYQGP